MRVVGGESTVGIKSGGGGSGELGWVYCRGEDVTPPAAHPSLPSAMGSLGMFSRNPSSCSGAVVLMVGPVQKLEVPSEEPEHPAGLELQQSLPLTKRVILFQNKRRKS